MGTFHELNLPASIGDSSSKGHLHFLGGFLLGFPFPSQPSSTGKPRVKQMTTSFGAGWLRGPGGPLVMTNRKWVITPVISGLTLIIPFIIGVITHLLSGMSHQVLKGKSTISMAIFSIANC